MSLDQSLFTLIFTPLADNPDVIDLVDPAKDNAPQYRKQRIPGPTYSSELYGLYEMPCCLFRAMLIGEVL